MAQQTPNQQNPSRRDQSLEREQGGKRADTWERKDEKQFPNIGENAPNESPSTMRDQTGEVRRDESGRDRGSDRSDRH